jgi:hypothetical protein
VKRTASERGTSRSNGSSIDPAGRARLEEWSGAKFAFCVDTGDNLDLDLRKVYRVRSEKRSLREGFNRIVDESGEDYLYSISFFVPVRLSEKGARVRWET